MRRLTHFFVLSAFLFSCGGHWYVLQAVAWINMIHDYSQSVPLTEAVYMTFSGKYPCEICHAIAEKKQQSEKDPWIALEKYDKKFLPPVTIVPVEPSSEPVAYMPVSKQLQFRTEVPPTPPPRAALS